ncbi:MAG: helical backbone metal receptor [Segetibacter sp.]
MIISIGKLVNKQHRASELASQIKEAFEQITPLSEKINTAYLIWKDPYMAAGGDTFIHDMLSRCGFTNIFQDVNRYPEISVSKYSINNTQHSINNSTSTINNPSSSDSYRDNSHPSTAASLSTDRCKLLLLSSEPYPFKQKHL